MKTEDKPKSLLPSFTYTCKSQSTNTDYLVQLHSAAFLILSCNISIERTDVFFHFSQIHTCGFLYVIDEGLYSYVSAWFRTMYGMGTRNKPS